MPSRTGGTATSFQSPRRNRPSTRMWIIALLCVVLPPLGLVGLWRTARCPMRGKLLLSALALASMTLMLVLLISHTVGDPYALPQPGGVYPYAQNDYYAPAAQPSADVQTATPAPAAENGDAQGAQDGIIMANPMG